MATDQNPAGRRDSNTQLLEELEALSQSLYQTHTSTTRRTASLALPRTSLPYIPTAEDVGARNEDRPNKPRSRRMSLSPWRSRPKLDDDKQQTERSRVSSNQPEPRKMDETAPEKKGIWNWKPIRALSHIGMHKMSCLFSVEVVTVQGLPASMNGLRLSVCVRKKETKDGAVNTMPSRVSQGAADFEETLFLKCHVYCTPGNGRPMKFQPRPFWIYAFAVDAQELDFGRSSVDLSKLIEESMEKSYEGTRVRQWDTSFNLAGKARGGELVVKLGFQIMEKDGGIGIYNQAQPKEAKSGKSFGRKQSKTSFSVPSPRLTSQSEAWIPSQPRVSADHPGMDDLNLDEPAPIPSTSPSIQKSEEPKMEDLDLPDFDVVDKGVEIQDKEEEEVDKEESEKSVEEKSTSSEVVKEVVHDQAHLNRLSELDSIAQQIKALESMMGEESLDKNDEESESQRLDADEENVTREFLQMLEEEDSAGSYNSDNKLNYPEIPPLQLEVTEDSSEMESKSYLSDLGKGLGCVVQTKDGGYLAAMNPLNTQVSRKDTPKLAMQISKPFIIASTQSLSGFELFQRMACSGLEELSSKIVALMSTEELMGKTAEQVAFEGIASAIIQGRNKEGASSTAARAIAAVKSMATALSTGRKERISTGIWNLNEVPLTIEEILAFSMQKLEEMTVEALKIQAEMAEEEAPFEVSALSVKSGGKDENQTHPLDSAVPFEDWTKKLSFTGFASKSKDPEGITLAAVVQLRDPLRRYEAVGGPVVALIHAREAEEEEEEKGRKYEEERRYKMGSLHVGGLKVRAKGGAGAGAGGKRNAWDTEKQRLTAMQWLVAYGLGKAPKKGKHLSSNGPDLLWSLSSRVMADMWLKPIRNPDVKFAN
ncbi:protein PLASTID MOVEMENT IMPAIRED 1 [Momordica charantia]|uniref:Protein PLASTID MOVEMENT IMPAIRED 1 n=1 Tax=Momordica charantia TaxID=3673 RepID=A0A6J1C3J4_MOMCH|nr:protein PLASTID MOVEMENT IMPAIRED 1 [Momordica charantia]